MLVDYLTLGLAPDAEDEVIRKRYLALIRRYTPERETVRFQQITAAYERIKDEPARLRSALFRPMEITDARQALSELVRAAVPPPRRIGLKALMGAVATTGVGTSSESARAGNPKERQDGS